MRARILIATLMLVPLGLTSLGAQGGGVREVTASERSLVQLNTKVRYTTMVLLPEGEELRRRFRRASRDTRPKSRALGPVWTPVCC